MNLQTSQLKSFLSAASFRGNNVIPILDHILIKDGYAIKTNLQTFCKYKIDATETAIIPEKDLRAIINNSETITVTKELSDGKYKIKLPIVDAAHFPTVPTTEDNGIVLTQDIMDALYVAKSFVSDLDADGALQLVHMKDNYIAATDRNKMYYETFSPLPEVSLFPETIELISKMREPRMVVEDNRVFFITPEYEIIATRTEDKSPNFPMVVEHLSKPGIDFKILRTELLGFIDLVNNITADRITVINMNGGGLTYQSDEKPGSFDIDLPEMDFNFNGRMMAAPLKSLPFDELNCTVSGQALVIREGKSLVAMYGVSI